MSSPEFLSTAAVRIVPDTSGFRAALVAELATATRGVVVPVPVGFAKGAGVAAATSETKALSVANTEATAAITGTAVAAQTAGAAAAEEAVALRSDARAAAEAAAAHEAFTRGAGASILTLFGLRGATLAASKGFLIGTAAVVTGAKAVREFSAETEAAARVQTILGPALARSSEEWAKQQAAIGLSTTAALKAEGAFAEVFHNLGLQGPAVASLSEQFVRLGEDISAFNNVSPDEGLRALQLAVSGNLRALRPFIGALRQADITARALRDSGKGTAGELTNLDLTLARISLILQKTENQTGAAARRQGDLAQQAKIAKSNLANLGAELGGPLAHALTGDLILLNKMFAGLNKVGDAAGFLGHAISSAAGFLRDPLGRNTDDAKTGLEGLGGALRDTGSAVAGLQGPLANAGAGFLGLTGPMNAATAAALNFRAAIAGAAAAASQIGNLQQHLLDLQFKGAPSSAQINDLQKQIKANQQIIRLHPTAKAVADARQARNAAKDQIDAIKAADAAAAKSATRAAAAGESAAAKAAREAQAALDKADQDILDQQGLKDATNQLAILKAQRTKSLVDDVSTEKAHLALIEQEIAQAGQIHDRLLRLQTLGSLNAALEQSKQTIRSLEAQQRQNKADRLKLIEDRKGQRLDLQVEIANVNANVKAEIAARNAKIRLDKEELKSVHGDMVRALQLRLEIAQETKAIKDLKKQKDDQNNAAKSLAFSFLQTQQGFAANLLSNLLPVGAARGTVGGAGGSSPALGPGTALSAAGQVSGAGGITRGQAGAMIDILRGIHAAIRAAGGGTAHPEAVSARAWTSTSMAHLGFW